MKVHLIKKQSIEDYVQKNSRNRASFKIWLSIIKRVDWNEPNDMQSIQNFAMMENNIRLMLIECN